MENQELIYISSSFLKCGHILMCKNHKLSLKNCPQCLKPIKVEKLLILNKKVATTTVKLTTNNDQTKC